MQPISMMVGNVEGPIRPLSTGAPFPASATVTVFMDETRTVTLLIRVMEDRPVLVSLTVGSVRFHPNPPEVTATELRALPLDELVRSAIRSIALAVADATPAPHRYDGVGAADDAERARKRRAMSDDLLGQVAEVFLANPDAPTRAVKEQLHCSYRTAARWVATARDRGFLPAIKEEP